MKDSVIQKLKDKGIPFTILQIDSHFGNVDTFIAYPDRYRRLVGGETYPENKRVAQVSMDEKEIRRFKRNLDLYAISPLCEPMSKPFGHAYEPIGMQTLTEYLKENK